MTMQAQPVNGQDINLAARATRKALDVLLAEEGTTFPPFGIVNTLVTRGGAMDLPALVDFIGTALELDGLTVRLLLHGLIERSLVRQSVSPDGNIVIELTPEGRLEHQRLSSRASEVTAELYRDLDPEDLAITRRVLVTLTERANARIAALLT
jgi:DNA-binding MarR family transcriptional regulator